MHSQAPILWQLQNRIAGCNQPPTIRFTHPVRIIDDDSVSSSEVDSEPPGPRAQQEHMAVRALTKHDHLQQDEGKRLSRHG